MAQIQASNGDSTPQVARIDVGALLKEVNDQIVAYEAKQLAKLKSELEAFEKKKDSVVKSYDERYEEQLKRWYLQNSEIELLHRTLTCLFKDSWQKYIKDCVCRYRDEIKKTEAAILVRQKCYKGDLEAKRDSTKAEAEAAKAYLDTISANQSKLDAAFAVNDKLITDIKKLLQGQDAPVSIYLFWFKLLSGHVALAPSPLPVDKANCLDFAKGQSPDELCPDSNPKSEATEAAETRQPPAEPEELPLVPSLIDPAKYGAFIDYAWDKHHRARESAGLADINYKKTPDDIASSLKALEELRKALDANATDCLKKISVTGDCGCGNDGETSMTDSTEPALETQAGTSTKQAAEAATTNAEG